MPVTADQSQNKSDVRILHSGISLDLHIVLAK